ncbi:PTS sugar transporter subunit IIA [Herbiconiux moechotypicola]|uniref:Mannitol-specific phosphotransferase enzyme IIA component n=1 Tax=Herbiconiux moechotypicola TaxID=637393 RepID=A0ABN3DT17_9MICO|nr:PTS sugar transporter subunit IIA [Herbiconiux moechotypicola]MCS5730557.1 PTS sugar transporter subunit IIA [Herbiconiux moechotypicola]
MSVLEPSQINLSGAAKTKDDAIAEAAAILVAAGAVTGDYLEYMLQREATVSTYMGNFLAIPHGTNEGKDTILASALSFVRYDEALDWGGEEVRFVVGIAGKEGGHMEILTKIAIVFSDEDEVARLLAAGSADEVLEILGDINE